jgi:hypothetical protein
MTLRRGGEVRLLRCSEAVTAQPARDGVGECESSSREEVVVVGKQTVRQAARLAASQVQAKYRRERVERDRRLERLAVEVLTALGEREAMIAATEQRAGAALQAMIIDEHLTVSEAVQWCAGAISHREAARLRQLAGRAQERPVSHSTLAANARLHDMEGEFH